MTKKTRQPVVEICDAEGGFGASCTLPLDHGDDHVCGGLRWPQVELASPDARYLAAVLSDGFDHLAQAIGRGFAMLARVAQGDDADDDDDDDDKPSKAKRAKDDDADDDDE